MHNVYESIQIPKLTYSNNVYAWRIFVFFFWRIILCFIK